MTTFLIITISGAIGYFIGNYQKSQRKEQFEREQDRMDAEFKARHVKNAMIAYDRQKCLNEREGYLRHIIAINEKSQKDFGRIYQDVNQAMTEYDSRHIEEWKQAGMVPPTYANKIHYYTKSTGIMRNWID